MPRRTRVSVGDFPRLTRFYGLSPEELASTPNLILGLYAEALPTLQAEELLNSVMVADMPHAEKGSRRRVFRTLERRADTPEEPQKIDVTTEAGRAQAAQFGIRVESPTEPKHDA